ncbi:DUF192 domain-containing protein [Myxococcota bacterium]|nr:DUF192 domain-containing protein [Myxococcota bacterium]
MPLFALVLLACATPSSPAPQAPSSQAPSSPAAAASRDPADGATGPLGPTIPLAIGHRVLQVEVADDEQERARGLMYRDGLAPGHGMVFVYPDERERGFWMRNTRVPLSIAFLDAQGRIVRLADMQPYDETTTRSLAPAMYALEVEQGWFAEQAVSIGERVEGLPGPSRD